MSKYKATLFSILFLFVFEVLNGQNPKPQRNHTFRAPVDIDMLLSGNFAELRGTHFHAGIDIKTNGQVGYNIYAIEGGYVSRVKISPYGYGHALYITHPNGYTSVYAHLDRFSIQIEQYVREQQYRKKSFAVDLFPDENFIHVDKGDVIGLGGNSGSSMGPHLHFEIRKTATEKPQNPLLWKFDIKDNTSPRFHHLYIYPLGQKSSVSGTQQRMQFDAKKQGDNYRIVAQEPIMVADTIGFGVFVNDYLNGSYNRCGVYDLTVRANEAIIYQLKLDEISFAEGRYVLSHMDYELNAKARIKAHKCFIDDGNRFNGYKQQLNNGKLYVAEGETKTIEITATDVYGNQSKLVFDIEGTAATQIAQKPASAKILHPGQINHFQSNAAIIDFPYDALYTKIYFNYEELPGGNHFFSNLHKIHNPYTPVHKHYNLRLKTTPAAAALEKKLYLARIYDNGKTGVATSNVRLEENWAVMRIREFGTFALMADTIAPEITLKNIAENKDMAAETGISVTIKDNETGIKTYNGYINGSWVLFQYDAKNDLIQYDFDDKMPEGETFELKLIVSDAKDNTTVKTLNFYKSASTSKK